ncbi:MAG: hypothetical protein IH881_00985 [Myxococcales bacterium]|nr:hypothetical protein [Myxococcales bacterium]MCH7866239.1 hypothetical protein [Myxococcales bacterium]
MKWGSLALALVAAVLTARATVVFAATDSTAKAGEGTMNSRASTGSKLGLSQGVDRLLKEIYERQKALTEVEREMARREAAVADLERLIEGRIAALEASRQEIEDRIAAWELKDGDRIKKLSKVYSAMPATKAARLLESLELDLAVAVIGKMKQKSSALILAAMPSSRALSVSRRLVRPLSVSPAGRSK